MKRGRIVLVKKMSKTGILILLVMVSVGASLRGQDLPEWYNQLRDAVYSQDLSSRDIADLYNSARAEAEKELFGPALSIMYSRCEYMMGRALLYEENKQDAAPYLERGMNYAQEALDQKASSPAWEMLAENLSQLCTVRSTAWLMANGGKVVKYAQNAVDLDPGNTAAQYLIAARWIYAPAPFRNIKKGIQMLQAILMYHNDRLQKDGRFNVYSSLGYASTLQKNNGDAKEWLSRALQVYPDNKFVGKMLAGL